MAVLYGAQLFYNCRSSALREVRLLLSVMFVPNASCRSHHFTFTTSGASIIGKILNVACIGRIYFATNSSMDHIQLPLAHHAAGASATNGFAQSHAHSGRTTNGKHRDQRRWCSRYITVLQAEPVWNSTPYQEAKWRRTNATRVTSHTPGTTSTIGPDAPTSYAALKGQLNHWLCRRKPE